MGGRADARLRRRPGDLSGHQHRSVPDRSRNRPWRHGRRLRGGGYAAPAHGCAQGAARRVRARSGAQGTADAGGARRRVAHPSFDRHHLRARRAGWLAVSRLRARARPDAARRVGTRSAPPRALAADPDRAGLGTGRRPRSRHRPSRLQAREHRPLPRRTGEDSRLRPGAAGRRRAAADADGHDPRHTGLHAAGAARGSGRRRADRRVRIRRRGVGIGHWRSSARRKRRRAHGPHGGSAGRKDDDARRPGAAAPRTRADPAAQPAAQCRRALSIGRVHPAGSAVAPSDRRDPGRRTGTAGFCAHAPVVVAVPPGDHRGRHRRDARRRLVRPGGGPHHRNPALPRGARAVDGVGDDQAEPAVHIAREPAAPPQPAGADLSSDGDRRGAARNTAADCRGLRRRRQRRSGLGTGDARRRHRGVARRHRAGNDGRGGNRRAADTCRPSAGV